MVFSLWCKFSSYLNLVRPNTCAFKWMYEWMCSCRGKKIFTLFFVTLTVRLFKWPFLVFVIYFSEYFALGNSFNTIWNHFLTTATIICTASDNDMLMSICLMGLLSCIKFPMCSCVELICQFWNSMNPFSIKIKMLNQ